MVEVLPLEACVEMGEREPVGIKWEDDILIEESTKQSQEI